MSTTAEPAPAVRVEVVLQLAPDTVDGDGRVSGSVRRDGAEPVPFVGWLSLLALLEQAARLPAAP